MKRFVLEDFSCKYCGATDVIRYGTENGTQYWWCKKCKHKFADNYSQPEMKTPPNQIASALSMYYEGMSLNAIRRHLDQQYNICPSVSTIWEWIDRYTENAVKKARSYNPDVGDVWVADETVLKIDGQNWWFWDLIDVKTRFLLASHMSRNRTTQHAKVLVEKASKRAGKTPKVIITDKLAAYFDGIELAFGAATKHIASKGFTVQPNTNLIERFHSTLKTRTKVMRGLKKPDTALSILDGWLVHYNFIRPHEALGDRTPAEKARIKPQFTNWADIVGVPKPNIARETKPFVIHEAPRITPKRPRISPKFVKLR